MMGSLLAWLTQPVPLAGLAVAVFTLRVLYIARRLQAASEHPTLADREALQEGERALTSAKEALASARVEAVRGLEDARRLLHSYREPSARSWRAKGPGTWGRLAPPSHPCVQVKVFRERIRGRGLIYAGGPGRLPKRSRLGQG